ncbi:MAG TPA: hypothetical protein VGC84_02610 [Ilumatobacteraceae bacterium]|jgi:hypothetical protein
MKFTRSSTICAVLLAVATVTACNPAERARQAKDDVDSGNTAACVEERAVMEKAVQAYLLLEPDTPVTEAGMVEKGYIHQTSVLMDVTSSGAVVGAAGTVCA